MSTTDIFESAVQAAFTGEGFEKNARGYILRAHDKKLVAIVRVWNAGTPHERAAVEFWGYTIEKPRQMDYYTNDLTKLSNRIKRLKRNFMQSARNAYERRTMNNQIADDRIRLIKNVISQTVGSLKGIEFTNDSTSNWTTIHVTLNNIELAVNANMGTRMRLGGQTFDIDICTAIKLIKELNLKGKKEEF